MTNAIISFDETQSVAQAMVDSKFFRDIADVSKAVVKILAGREMGFGPFASMRGVYVIQGAPAISANLMAAAVKRSGRYNYRVKQMTDAVCEIEFLEGGQPCGTSVFTAADAQKAGTQNMQKFPRNMLFARAMSNGVRWFCPDVLGGAAVYTPEELGEAVNEDGDVIDAEPVAAEEPAPMPPSIIERMDAKKTSASMTLDEACAITNSEGTRYGDIDTEKLTFMLNTMLKKNNPAHAEKIAAAKIIIESRKQSS